MIDNEMSQEEMRANEITTKIGPTMSPIVDSARKKARNAAEVVNVEIRSGVVSSAQEEIAAAFEDVGMRAEIYRLVEGTEAVVVGTKS